MSHPPRPGAAGGASSSSAIPSVEIGSFVAATPDRSEFIGSASGVFFVNTVFRAFAKVAPADSADESRDGPSQNPSPDTAPVHNLLGAEENQVDEGGDGEALDPTAVSDIASSPVTRSYGILAPGLGAAPPPEVAKELLMLYFRHWHPFFPFLHGPTFFEQVNHFYESQMSATPESASASTINHSVRIRLCQAVTFQCIFNLADIASDKPILDHISRIQSPSALLTLLGAISNSNDLPSLQGLIAAELYLVATMSLRPASTVSGMVSRMAYHSGLHRCPFRYVGVPEEMCIIRKRIFWSAYILDRCVSQFLGHPVTVQDSQVDVCIPGQAELHQRPPLRTNDAPAALDEVRSHLPRDHPDKYSTEEPSSGLDSQEDGRSATRSAARSIRAPRPTLDEGRTNDRELVFTHMIKYSKLLGEVIELFHNSIHDRSITRDMVEELISKTHRWWNSLPPSFQDDWDVSASDDTRPYMTFFTVTYNYLLLIINRPFLSLPPGRKEFRTSLEVAVSASRNIIQSLKRHDGHKSMLSWPLKLAATWMSGLVVAFAGVLNAYPFHKAESQIAHCLQLLATMIPRWPSAKHCHQALTGLMSQLTTYHRSGGAILSMNHNFSTSTTSNLQGSPISDTTPTPAAKKRKRGMQQANGTNTPASSWQQQQVHPGPWDTPILTNNNDHTSADTNNPNADLFAPLNYPTMPVLEYNGPDFGFDSAQMGSDSAHGTGGFQNTSVSSTSNPSFNNAGADAGLYGFAGWEAFMQGLNFDGF